MSKQLEMKLTKEQAAILYNALVLYLDERYEVINAIKQDNTIQPPDKGDYIDEVFREIHPASNLKALFGHMIKFE